MSVIRVTGAAGLTERARRPSRATARRSAAASTPPSPAAETCTPAVERSAATAVASSESRHAHCDFCSSPARIRVLERYEGGQPVFRATCLACADHAAARRPRLAGPRPRLSMMLAVVGLSCAAATAMWESGVAAEWLPDLAAQKGLGLIIGSIVMTCGALMGTELLIIGGLAVFGGAAITMLLGVSYSPGLGWKDQIMLTVSLVCCVLAVIGRLGLLSSQWDWIRTRIARVAES